MSKKNKEKKKPSPAHERLRDHAKEIGTGTYPDFSDQYVKESENHDRDFPSTKEEEVE